MPPRNYRSWQAQRHPSQIRPLPQPLLCRSPPASSPAAWIELATLVASDHRQRGVAVDADSLEVLVEQRDHIQDAIRHAGVGSGHVRAWIWQAASSGGTPLTALGERVGAEIRLSWYQAPAP